MSENIVYILGAGFSAPLGLPLMSNFLVKSKNLYFSEPDKYKHFKSVFDAINELSVSKNYYSADLFNIEEILSIIEMGTFLEGNRLKKVFLQYITDVIKFHTPEIEPYPGNLPGNWHNFIFGENDLIKNFGYFTANLLGMEFKEKRLSASEAIYRDTNREHHANRISSRSVKYAVITLNYDLVLENFCKFMNTHYQHEAEINFNSESAPGNWDNPPLAKLHGSLDTGLIVPPTWAKGNNPKITPIWKYAFQMLRDANHIRFIGYSLPIADSYIKFLLKSAVVKTEHLKSIDVICVDNDGTVKQRYDDFLEFNYYRFTNANVIGYLNVLSEKQNGAYLHGEPVRMNQLETAHDYFMNNY